MSDPQPPTGPEATPAPALSPDPPADPAPSTGIPSKAAPRLLVLNAVFPGLGHLSAGRVKWALLLGVPMLVAARGARGRRAHEQPDRARGAACSIPWC